MSTYTETYLSLCPLTRRICNRKAQLALLTHVSLSDIRTQRPTELTLTRVALLLKVFKRHCDAFVFPLLILFLLFLPSSFGFGRCGLCAHSILHSVFN